MRLSIILPVLNEAQSIAATLEQLAPLRARGVEVIVVDGGSRDGTPAIAAPRADAVLAAPRGRASQMNAGAARAAGDVLCFVHADTLVPAAADHAIAAALDRPQAHWGRFDVAIAGRSAWLAVVAAMMNWRSRASGIATGDQAIFVRRTTFERLGGFPAQPLMEDIALSRSLKRVAPPVCLRLRVTTSGRRWERHGVWRTILLMWWLRLRYFLGASPERLARSYAER